ncbi:histidine kinase [Schizophyllum commune Tattone D]|nr:histidine kinase [Schizophyllum commune Tattone D]
MSDDEPIPPPAGDILLAFAPEVREKPVAKYLLSFDWASTPLGPITEWPQSLKTVVALMLVNPSQSCMFWGPEKTVLYNDAWAQISGAKHPHLMGRPGRVAFHEIWDTFSQHCDQVYSGKLVGRVDDLVLFESHATEEQTASFHSPIPVTPESTEDDPPVLETYFTWSYLPVQIEDGSVGGIINNCMETTDKVLSERRMHTVRRVAECTSLAQTTAEFWPALTEAFTDNHYDFPYFMCYAASAAESAACDSPSGQSTSSRSSSSSSIRSTISPIRLQLKEAVGIPKGHPAAPEVVELHSTADEGVPWPFVEACMTRMPIRAANPFPVVEHEDDDAGRAWAEYARNRAWGDPPGDAVVMPLTSPDGGLIGVLVLGLNTRRPYAGRYANFHATLVKNLSASYAATLAFEQQIQRAEELRALDRAKTVFFQNVSHELRTPLTLIRGPCEDALRAEKLDPAARTRFRFIDRASKRLLRLVNSLMLFSSAEARKLQAHYRPVKLGSVTADMASLFRSGIERAGLTFNVNCEDQDGKMVFIDVFLWEKIVFNLLSNALKYTKEGFINVNLRYTSAEAILRVEDSGCGIPSDHVGRVLDRFHRVESSEGRSVEGTGIGLALTSELVKLHGGRIDVTSELGRGSAFTVHLPLGDKHLPQEGVEHEAESHEHTSTDYMGRLATDAGGWLAEDSADSTSQSSAGVVGEGEKGAQLQPFKVLLTEDDEDARQYIHSILRGIVQEVVTVPDGMAALEYIESSEKPPDLLVTDMMMPRMNGAELLQTLTHHHDTSIQAMPAIVLTARTGQEGDARVDGLLHGPVDYLLKPFSATELTQRVETRLQALRQKQELERLVEQRTAALDSAQQRYRRMSELAPVALFETDEDDRELITYANERFFALTGLPKVLPLRLDVFVDMVAPQHQAIVREHWLDVLANGVTARFDFLFVDDKNVFAEIIPSASGGLLATLTDQTEQRRFLAQQLDTERAKADEAVRQRRLQEAFIDIVSHELRNPLSAILQSADLLSGSIVRLNDIMQEVFVSMKTGLPLPGQRLKKLMDDSETELQDASHAVASVELCARHQTIIASDILVVSRLDSNLLSMKPTMFHLMDEMRSTLAMFSVQAETQNIKFLLKPEGVDAETRIVADPTRLCQILVNLISNSCRVLESWEGKREITIEMSLEMRRPFALAVHSRHASEENTDPTHLWLTFHISDTGPGIPVEDQARLFTRFNDVQAVQTAGRRSSSMGGTGLGLYLCRKLAELQGGAIKFDGEAGKGASFLFFIEARLAPPAPSAFSAYAKRSSERFERTGSISPRPGISRTTSDVILHHAEKRNGTQSTPEVEVGARQATSNGTNLKSEFKPDVLNEKLLSVPVVASPDLDPDMILKRPEVRQKEEEARRRQESEREERHRQESSASGQEGDPAERASLHVLVVEDNAVNQRLLRRQLEKAGFLVDTANHGLQALQLLEEGALATASQPYPSVVLMDLEMPVMDGLEATSRIRALEEEGKLPPPKMPIFAITGNARQGQVDAALAVGMDEVFIKPYRLADVVARIDRDGRQRMAMTDMIPDQDLTPTERV